MSNHVAQSTLFDAVGASYESAFGHDPGLIAFVKDDIIPRLSADAHVLDIGSGTGKPVAAMITEAGRSLHGIDCSPTMVELASKQVPRGFFQRVDLLQYAANPGTFDAGIASLSLLSLSVEQTKFFMGRLATWIKLGGWLFLVTISTEGYGRGSRDVGDEGCGARMVECMFMGNIVEILLYTADGWRELLNASGFEIVDTKDHFFVPTGGDCDPEPHYFIIARKS